MTAATLERPPLSGDKGSAPRAQSMLWTDARRRFGVWVLLLIVAFLVGMPLIKLQGLLSRTAPPVTIVLSTHRNSARSSCARSTWPSDR